MATVSTENSFVYALTVNGRLLADYGVMENEAAAKCLAQWLRDDLRELAAASNLIGGSIVEVWQLAVNHPSGQSVPLDEQPEGPRWTTEAGGWQRRLHPVAASEG